MRGRPFGIRRPRSQRITPAGYAVAEETIALARVAIVLALVSSLLWGLGDFAGGTASRRLSALVVVLASQAAGLVAAAIVAWVTGAWSDSMQYVPWAIAAGIVGVVGLLAFYEALARGTMGVISPIAALSVIVPVAAGLITGQWPTMVVGIGFVLAISGVVAASGPERSAGRSLRPVMLAAVAAVCFGAVLILIAAGARSSPVMTMVVMRAASVATLTVAALAMWQARARHARRRGPASSAHSPGAAATRPRGRGLGAVWTIVIAAGLCDVSANLAYAYASTLSALTIVAILGSLYPVVTVAMARIVHGEHMKRLQQVGIAVALTGVALIAGWS